MSGLMLAFDYLRLSNEEAKSGESASIVNQRMIIENYCKQNGITLVREFVDDGYSGGNFNRPGFQEMMRQLEEGRANIVITKDLSRLGRDMREASYYAEQFFPERGIRYIAIADNFDTEHENIMAPFQFAMNEVYLRDGSRKVKDVLKNKRENGQYCACPPYGYKKDPKDKNHLIPDENTAPIVQRIFRQAADGDSSRKIAMDLTRDGIIPPMKYRVYRDNFSDAGAAQASDDWNYTTVKRILKNKVYLGHTQLGKTKKVSVKSKKKVKVDEEKWAVTLDTHPPLVSSALFERAQENLGKAAIDYRAYDHVRKSIFSGVARCGLCGYSLCSGGTVYKGRREEYWYLTCTHKRSDIPNPCTGTRIRYEDLMELVRQELNQLLSMTKEEMNAMVNAIIAEKYSASTLQAKELQRKNAEAKLEKIDTMIRKAYVHNAEGLLDDDRLAKMVADYEAESRGLRALLQELSAENPADKERENYEKLFRLVQQYTHLDQLDRDVLLTFIERIEVGPKVYPEGTVKVTHRNQPFTQEVRIFYKFVGELGGDPTRSFPV